MPSSSKKRLIERLTLDSDGTGLTYAFDVLGVRAVVSCTVCHNLRSRAVMERIGMRYAGEICSRGTVEGEDNVRDDAPFTVCVMLGEEREP